MVAKSVEKIIKEYIQLLKKDGIPVRAVLLFGSWAKGKASKDSDIDVCVISESFGNDRLKEGQMLFEKARLVDSRIEPVPCSYNDYKRDRISPLLAEIRKNSVRVL